MKTRLTFINARVKCEVGQAAHKTVLKISMGFGAEALLQSLIDKVDALELSNQDLLQSNADLTDRLELIEDNDAFPIKIDMVVMVDLVVTDMSDYMGYGTWSKVCAGRSPMGAGFTTDARGESITFTVGGMGGEYKHEMTTDENGQHNHPAKATGSSGNRPASVINFFGSGTDNSKSDRFWSDSFNIMNTAAIGISGNGDPHNTTHPYQVFEIWKRIS